MRHRLVGWFGVIVFTAALPVAGQAPAAQAPAKGTWLPIPASAKGAKVAAKRGAPRTPWGDPDLQGVWNDATSTPLQRPGELGEKDVLNDDEAAEFREQLARNLTRDRRDGGAELDV